jgi:hypothetical protein
MRLRGGVNQRVWHETKMPAQRNRLSLDPLAEEKHSNRCHECLDPRLLFRGEGMEARQLDA